MSYRIKNRAGNIVEVSEEIYQRMARRGEVVEVLSSPAGKSTEKEPVKSEIIIDGFSCPVCLKQFKSEKSLKMHRLRLSH